MLIRELETLTGGLSKPSKMPGFAYGLPAWKCLLGSVLAKKAGSVCSSCYALKGMYVFPVVKRAQERRLEAISRVDWTALMIELIGKKYRNRFGADRVFRWHDSGDLQSSEHLEKIVQIARALPDIRFWLPTRERKIVLAHGEFPSNLVVRISAQMVGQNAGQLPNGMVSSTVGVDDADFQCPARKQGNECKNCRACWSAEVSSVNYPLH